MWYERSLQEKQQGNARWMSMNFSEEIIIGKLVLWIKRLLDNNILKARDKFYLDFMFVEPCLGKRANKDEMHAPLEAGYFGERRFRKKKKHKRQKA